MSEEAELTPYSPLWPAVFDIEKRRLLEIFRGSPTDSGDSTSAVVIEHVGSTAVPGLGAKPIIDIMVGAPDLAFVDARIPALQEAGYRYVPEFTTAFPDRRYLTRLDQPPGRFQLNAVVLDSPYWRRLLAFRDALRANPALAQKYWRIKQRQSAARHGGDRSVYNEAKSDFIRAVLENSRNG